MYWFCGGYDQYGALRCVQFSCSVYLFLEAKPMRRLFIQDSESTRTFGKLLRLVVGVLIALVISDFLLGRVLPFITTEPPFILRFENVPGVEALWKFSEAGIKSIIFTGSSQTYAGISPHDFDNHIKAISGRDVNSVNVSVLASIVTIQRDLIHNLLIPNHPQIILYGIEMRAAREAFLQEEFFSIKDFKNKALGYALSQASDAERNSLLWFLRHSNWARYRDNFRQWLTGAPLIDEKLRILAQPDDLGYAPFPNTFSDSPAPDNILYQFTPFKLSDLARQMMVDIGTDCDQSGVQCILLNMPLHQSAYQYITAEDEAQYEQLLQAAGLPIWDFNTAQCRAVFGNKNFFNINHLNSNGAVLFSQMIADVYAQVVWGIPIQGDANCATF
jgi:hypothetical protein